LSRSKKYSYGKLEFFDHRRVLKRVIKSVKKDIKIIKDAEYEDLEEIFLKKLENIAFLCCKLRRIAVK
jgi:hypothetical protein